MRTQVRATLVAVALVFVAFGSGRLSAGSPDSPGGPTSSAAQMYTFEQLYQRLATGAVGTKMTSFTEPSTAPGTATMHDVNDIMGVAPTVDNTNGATTADVLTGKTFWGRNVTSGQWGLQTGTATSGSNVSGGNGLLTFNIPNGFYSGKTATANDTNLVASNIAQGVILFGVTGTANLASGNAIVADVLSGKTFSNSSGTGLSGTMTNNGAVTITPSTSSQTIAE